jgi:hypothetical protein
MKNYQIYKDLNTSFVSLSDLLKSLRKQRFVGKVNFKSGKYEANIFFTKNKQLKAYENIKRGGRILTNKEILRHILFRGREPNGIVNVYREPEKPEPILKRLLPGLHKKFDSVKAEYSFADAQFTSFLPRIHKQKDTSAKKSGNKKKNASVKKAVVFNNVPMALNQNSPLENIQQNAGNSASPIPKPGNDTTPIPKPGNTISTDWEILLSLTGEILGTVDKHLAKANLNFAWMFEKTRLEFVADDSSLNPDSWIFKYENGKIEMHEEINSQVFVEYVLKILQGVLKTLRSNSKFNEVYLTVNQEILVLVYDRKQLYDKFSLTSKLKKIAIN